MVKVKICGITNEEDALNAIRLGADYIGFLIEIEFSKDKITREEAKEIIKKLPNKKTVFVTYLQKADEIIEIADFIKPKLIQLHNIIEIKEIKKIRKELPKIKIIKAIPVEDVSAIDEAKKYEKYVDYILLDTKGEKGRGGTGKVHDWSISAKIAKLLNKKVFLAGGLNPDNVEEAIKKVKPYTIDTNSGVKLECQKFSMKILKNALHFWYAKNLRFLSISEHAQEPRFLTDRKKDKEKMRLFIERAKKIV